MIKHRWFIPGNVPSSKNGRRWTGKYFIASKAVMNYRKATKDIYAKYADEFKAEVSKLTLPVKVSFEFIRGTRHKFDYINPAQTVQDDMVKHGWIGDDNAEFIIPAFEQYVYDKKNPGVWIELILDEKKDNNSGGIL
tara:strand:- start:212 stop:622 length:411 start_codon:yes stop_codon:yes gene_type:complete